MNPTRNDALIARRKHWGLLQEQVANAVGISYRYYQRLEAGECKLNVETAISIARILSVKVEELFATQTTKAAQTDGQAHKVK